MEEEFEYGSPEEQKLSVDRYEEMIRNQDQYFLTPKLSKGLSNITSIKTTPSRRSKSPIMRLVSILMKPFSC